MLLLSTLCILLLKIEITGRAANSVDFYIEFKFEFELSSFYVFEFNILIFASSKFEFEFCENLSSFFELKKK